MIRPRTWYVLSFAVSLAPALRADDKPASSWTVDRSLSVSPQSGPVPEFAYRLLPLSSELKPGNSIPIYLRLALEQTEAAQKYWTETPKAWNLMPVDDVPSDRARKFLEDHHYLLRQLELGARRRTAEWNYTLDAGDVRDGPISMLLPDLQCVRKFTPMLILQARTALAQGDFTAAAHHLETGFAFGRHLAEGPTLIHRVVAISLVSELAGTVADFIERPGSPNLYWALTALPHPLIDLRTAQEWEYRMVELQIPELADLSRERTAEQWDEVLRRVRAYLRRMGSLSSEGATPKLPDWFPTAYDPRDPAAKSSDLPAARKFVARARSLTAEQVEAMPPAQVLLLYMMATYHQDRDDYYRGIYVPYPRCISLFAAADNRLRNAPAAEGHLLSRLFLPALPRVIPLEFQVERNVAALRVIEALRMYAAAHGGRLPDNLNEVTEVPIPEDPGTRRPFEFSRDGEGATLVSQVPDDPFPNNSLRYRVIIRKK
jgi:hypothetical protein